MVSNSPLSTYTNLSPNCSKPRKKATTRFTPHCVVGQWTAKQICDYFTNPSLDASCNYGIGKDGSIGTSVDEDNRAWTSSSSDNDNQAITFEIASDTTHPYAMTDKAIEALKNLMVDYCQRHGKTKVLWFGDKEKTLSYTPEDNEMVITVHRWFAQKACPGDYLYNLLGDIAAEVTKRLEDDEDMDISKLTDGQIIELANRIDAIRGEQEVSSWASGDWNKAKEKGVFDGTAPKNPLTREQAATAFSRLNLI